MRAPVQGSARTRGTCGQDLQPAGLQNFKVLFLENCLECPKLAMLAGPRHPQSQKLNKKIEKEKERGKKEKKRNPGQGHHHLKATNQE